MPRFFPATRCLCAALVLAVCASAAHAGILIDDFTDDTNPTFAGVTRTLITNPLSFSDPDPNLIVIDGAPGFLSYDGDGIDDADDDSASVVFDAISAGGIDVAGRPGIGIVFVQIGGPNDELYPVSISIEIVDINNQTATLDPFDEGPIVGQFPGVRVEYLFSAFAGIGGVDLSALDTITVTLHGQLDLIVAIDSISVTPAPSAASMGLLAMVMIAARRQRS